MQPEEHRLLVESLNLDDEFYDVLVDTLDDRDVVPLISAGEADYAIIQGKPDQLGPYL